MAHPYAKHAGHRAAQRRAKKLAAGGCAGADKMPFSSAGIESKRNRKTPDEADLMASGNKGAKRYARGGKIKKPAHTTNIAIVVPHHPTTGAPGAPSMAGAPMAGPPGMPPGMPAGGPPGMPPGLPPGMPMRARGGRLPTAGAASGVGREEKAAYMKRKGG